MESAQEKASNSDGGNEKGHMVPQMGVGSRRRMPRRRRQADFDIVGDGWWNFLAMHGPRKELYRPTLISTPSRVVLSQWFTLVVGYYI